MHALAPAQRRRAFHDDPGRPQPVLLLLLAACWPIDAASATLRTSSISSPPRKEVWATLGLATTETAGLAITGLMMPARNAVLEAILEAIREAMVAAAVPAEGRALDLIAMRAQAAGFRMRSARSKGWESASPPEHPNELFTASGCPPSAQHKPGRSFRPAHHLALLECNRAFRMGPLEPCQAHVHETGTQCRSQLSPSCLPRFARWELGRFGTNQKIWV